MTLLVARITLRLRLPGAVSAAVGLIAVMAAVGALFPTVGHTIETLNVPKAAAIAAIVVIIGFASWIGLIVGVALGGGGISIANMTALAVQLAFFGFATGALAIALGAGTGRRSLATGVAAAVAILGWLIDSFAPLVSALNWLRYLSPFYYYAGHGPLTKGVDVAGVIVLGVVSLVLTALGMSGIERRDLRA